MPKQTRAGLAAITLIAPPRTGNHSVAFVGVCFLRFSPQAHAVALIQLLVGQRHAP
ncbi:hypothetical protein PCI56_04335 [Plesiomonas shigelloides subsp. oncorhynchi]|nr:hypothetical protein [Plesiomonas shigelloides]